MGHVLDLLLAHIVKRQLELALHVVIGCSGDHHAPWRTELLQAGCDIDSVAEQVLALYDDIAEINAHPKDNAAICGNIGLSSCEVLLQGESPATPTTLRRLTIYPMHGKNSVFESYQ